MIRDQETPGPDEPEREQPMQQAEKRGIATDERLKRLMRQHPQRDEPRVESIDPNEGREKGAEK